MRAFPIFFIICLGSLGCANSEEYHMEEQKVIKELRALDDDYLMSLLWLPKSGETREVLLDGLLKCVAKIGLKLYPIRDYKETILGAPTDLETAGELRDLAKKFRKEIEECVNFSFNEMKEVRLYSSSEEEVDNLGEITSLVRVMGLSSLRYFAEGNIAMGVKYIVAILKIAQRLSYSDVPISGAIASVYVKWVVDILSQHLGDISHRDADVIGKEMEFFTIASLIRRLQHIQANWLASNIRWYVSLYPDSLLSNFAKGDRHWIWKDVYKSSDTAEKQKANRRRFIKLILFALKIYRKHQSVLSDFLGSSDTRVTLPKIATPPVEGASRTAYFIEHQENSINGLLQHEARLSEAFLCVLRIHRYAQEKQKLPSQITSFLSEVARKKLKKHIRYKIDEDKSRAQIVLEPVGDMKTKTWYITLPDVKNK